MSTQTKDNQAMASSVFAINKLTDIEKFQEHISFEEFMAPLMNVNHTFRLPLQFDGKERSAMMPAGLFLAMKIKLSLDMGVDPLDKPGAIKKDTLRLLRDVMIDIEYAMEDDGEGDISLSKTFQEKVFRHLVWGEPLQIDPQRDLIRSVSANLVHTVTMRKTPSFTIPSYLCRWVLESEGLPDDTPFTQINSYLKLIAMDVHDDLKAYDRKKWKSVASFSRRVQNIVMLDALKKSENISPEFFERKVLTPRS